MAFLDRLSSIFVAPAQSNGHKRRFPDALPPATRGEAVRLWEEGWLHDDIADELGISVSSVQRIIRAAERKTSGGQQAAPSFSAELDKLSNAAGAFTKFMETMTPKGAAAAAPTAGDGYEESSQDIIENIRARAAKQLEADPEVIAAIAQDLKTDIIGSSRYGRKTGFDRLKERIEERVIDEMAGGRNLRDDGDFDLREVLREAGETLLVPLAKSLFPGYAATRERQEQRALTEGHPDGAPQPATEPARLLGAFGPSDLALVVAEDDPAEAADAAWDHLQRYFGRATDAQRAKSAQDLNGFLALPESLIEPLLSNYASDPAWAPVIQTLLNKPKGWLNSFRSEIRAIAAGEAEPSAPAGGGEELEHGDH